jgi:hypothetical protein
LVGAEEEALWEKEREGNIDESGSDMWCRRRRRNWLAPLCQRSALLARENVRGRRGLEIP